MKTFEEGCVTSLPHLLSSLGQPNHLKTLSICGNLVYKINGIFIALDEVERVNLFEFQRGKHRNNHNWDSWVDISLGIRVRRQQENMCSEIVDIFSFAMTATHDAIEVAGELPALLQRFADTLKLLI